MLAGACLAITFIALALLHVFWVLRGSPATAAIPTRPDGTPLFRPGPGMTLAVAGALLLAALVVAAGSGILTAPVPALLVRAGAWGLGAVFAVRAIGDFRYVGFFKRVRGTRFARQDTMVYSPLCAVLATGVFWVAAG
jgi:hypothetical protein